DLFHARPAIGVAHFVGTRSLSSWSQFCTTTITAAAGPGSGRRIGRIIRNRRPSAETSNVADAEPDGCDQNIDRRAGGNTGPGAEGDQPSPRPTCTLISVPSRLK